MYAILQQSGHQYRVSPGDRLLVDRLTAEVGSVVALEPVVLVQGDAGTQVGTPVVEGVRVAAVVVSHPKGGKIRVFKYKAKKRYRRTHGHRSLLTELRIESVLAAGEKLPAPKPKAAPAPKAAAKPKRTKAATAAAETEAAAPSAAAEVAEAITAEAAAETVAEAPEAPAAEAPKTAAKPKRTKAAPAAEATTAPAAEATAAPAAETTDAPAPRKRATRKKADTTDTPAADGGETEA